jgi:nicotinamidase-related amidase
MSMVTVLAWVNCLFALLPLHYHLMLFQTLGYKVYTLEDCCAATSIEAHKNAFANDFGMFSVPTKSTEVIDALKSTVSA